MEFASHVRTIAVSWTVAWCLLGLGVSLAQAAEPAPDPVAIEFFETKVRPVFATHCYKCHGPEKQEGGLRLDAIETILSGGDQGPALVPGKPDESLIIQGVRYNDENFQMPPKGRLTDQQIADLDRWVKMGAPAPKSTVDPATLKKEFNLAERRKHWAFQPVKSPQVAASAMESPIDVLLVAKLKAAGLAQNPQADKRTLIRRASFDLIGLPPSSAEVQAFLADDSEQAFAKVVDRLLESPHFGERWARHWLDLVRYAETRGHEFDYLIPNAYQYRDYVIRALNADVPYDRFVTEHIAGDLLASPRLNAAGANESILGTGFWFLGEEVHSPVDICADNMDRLDNKIDVMTKTFLGVTVACARCHDHKFDAISTKDYYALSGFLQSASYRQVAFETMEVNRRIAEKLTALDAQHRAALLRTIGEAQAPLVEKMASYLEAAHEVSRLGPLHDPLELESERKPGKEAGLQRRIQDVAANAKLDAEQLGRWLSFLDGLQKSPEHPFYVWHLLNQPKQARDFGPSLAGFVEGARRKREAAANRPSDSDRVIVDYASAGRDDWYQDGFVFGQQPAQTGDVRLAGSSPLSVEVVSLAGSHSDSTWNRLALAPGNEREPGRIGWLQSGRTLRTPEFNLKSGRLHYLVRGTGNVYAPVDSHRVNNGPLHGKLALAIKSDKLQWVAHDLSVYTGHRVHVEFTPAENGSLAVYKVVEADTPPALPALTGLLDEAVANLETKTPQSLAQAFAGVFAESFARLGADRLRGSERGTEYAELANVALQLAKNLQIKPADIATPGEMQMYLSERQKLVEQIQLQSHTAPAMLEGSGVDQNVLIRGNYRTPGDLVPRRFLEAVAGSEQQPIGAGSGRLELARRLSSPENPLFSRVMANRVWQHLFGRGIVASVDNFGVMGELPSDPELLDYLAIKFAKDGYSLKTLIRNVMLSKAYRMSSKPNEKAVAADPQNRLWHHMPLKRLEGEVIRDTILAVSGQLDPKLYGPSIEVHLTAAMEGRGRPGSGPLDGARRRSIYLKVRRNFLSGMFLAFDTPSPFSTVGRRAVSNVPAQALTLMNSPFVVEQTQRWAQRLLADASQSPTARVTAMYEAAFTRSPTEDELKAALEFVSAQAATYGAPAKDPRAWSDLCHVLVNVKEFIFVR